MILDEIYEAIKTKRLNNDYCPFPKEDNWENCNKCRLLFPEIDGLITKYCPCILLGDDYVKSEMRRLFP